MRISKLYIIAFFLLLTGCSDSFLDSEPLTEKTSENYYKTPQDAWETLVGCYDLLPGDYGDFFLIANIASDECYGGGGYTDAYGNQVWDEFKDYNDLEINRYTWRGRYYKAIRRCTVLTEVLDQIDWGDQQDLRTRYEAEARFLRAHFYFEMQRNFGHIPLVKTSIAENIPQTDPDEVYAYIIDDLEFAIANLPATRFGDIASGDVGRATKWAAEGYLARVFLFYTGYYGKTEAPGVTKQETIDYLEDCIQNSGHSLVERYGSLWPWSKREDYHHDPTLQYAGEYNPEIVFAIKNSVQRPNGYPKYIGMRGAPYSGAYAPFYPGWGMATITPECFNRFEEGDTRRFASIIDLETEGIPNVGGDQREFTGYEQKKYMTLTSEADPAVSDPEANGASSWTYSYQDQIIMRYSDVLLMAAELEMDSHVEKSQAYLDLVRDRAFRDENHRIPATGNAIFNERGFEFVFEGIRYYDVLRQGLQQAKEILDVHDAVVWNGGHEVTKNIDFPLEKQGLLRIPQSEIELSEGLLIQNPGWN